MFHGSIPAEMRQIVGEYVSQWACDDIYVGCSGNFTVERVIADVGAWRIHSNDITVYSAALGRFFSGSDLGFEFNEAYDRDLGFIKPSLSSPVDVVATVMLLTRVAPAVGHGDNAYYARLMRAFRDQWADMHAATVSRLSASPLTLASYFSGDVYDFADMSPKDQGFISYPPFFGESRDYEKSFELIADVMGYSLPEYEIMSGKRMAEFFEHVMEFRHWLFGTKESMPQFDKYLRGVTQTTNRGVSIYVYSNNDTVRIVQPVQETEPVLVPRLAPGQEVGDRMWLAPLTAGQFGSLRSLYMNENIKPGQASVPVAVMVDDVMVGVFAYSTAPNLSSWDTHIEGPTVYLLSDFPVAPSDYPRLSKLVLYAALSKEGKLLAERASRKRVVSCVTTAFSKRPTSMKYRGLFKLLTRTKQEASPDELDLLGPADLYYANSYKLNYGQTMGQWDLAEGLAIWKKKHGKKDAE